MLVKLGVNIGKLKLTNPVMVASGTFGYAEEFKDFMDLKQLGGIVSKTITLKARRGNPPARTCETPCGMLNSIGLENPGVEGFLKEKLPALARIGVPLIVSIASEKDPEEFVTLAKRLDNIREVAAIEANISCPNIKSSRLVSQDSKSTYDVISQIRKVTSKTLIVKLSPNVTDITEIALAAEAAGADAVSLINTITGMSIDIRQRTPKLACVTGGLSGPAIRPIAVRMVWEVYQKINIPVIGMGGIIDISSALEFFIAGASAVAVGTGNFVNPKCANEVVAGLEKYMAKNKIKDMEGLIGSLRIEE